MVLDELEEFWRLAASLKQEPRRGWMQRFRPRRVESVADHSFAVALLSLFEGERRGYDMEKMLKLALIHDLEEAITGDLTPGDKKRMTPTNVSREKDLAIARTLARIPQRIRKDYRELWKDLRSATSKEARLVKDLDRLEMALQAKEYARRGVDSSKLRDFYSSAAREIKDGSLKRILQRIGAP